MSKLLKSAFCCSLRISSGYLSLTDVILKRPLQRQLIKWSAGQFAYHATSRGSACAVKWTTRNYRAGHRENSPASGSVSADYDVDAFSDEDADTHSSGYELQSKQTRNSTSQDKWNEMADVVDEEAGNFGNFHISESTQSKLRAKGIPFLFAVQTNTFKPIFDGKDVIVQARTGCGKTLSYALPLIERLQLNAEQMEGRKIPRLLVMTPTRELARQVSEVISSLTDNLSVVTVYGGASITGQESQLCSGVDVVVGTPGRIADFLQRGTLSLTRLQHVVLDEVDRMLDMGFADSVDDILSTRYTPGNSDNNPQTLLFSATVPQWVQKTARKYLRKDITKLDLVGRGTVRTATTVEHLAMPYNLRDRATIIANLLKVYSGVHGRAIIFCETKRDADALATSNTICVETHALHGDISQDKRELVLKGFRDGRYRCLIATDVAARGLDIPEVDLVVQCSPPKDVDSYIHRSGRTGRAGRPGVSVLLFNPVNVHDVTNVERIAGIKFKRINAPSGDMLVASAVKDAVRSLDDVPQSVVDRFRKSAEDVVSRVGAVPALAAAIAVITGNSRPCSLLTASQGYTTYLLKSETKIDRLGKAWLSLEQTVPLQVKIKAKGMRLCADHSGCVFDIPSACDAELDNVEGLSRPTELPELEEPRINERTSGGSGYLSRDSGGGSSGGYNSRGGKEWTRRDNNWSRRDDRDDSWSGRRPSRARPDHTDGSDAPYGRRSSSGHYAGRGAQKRHDRAVYSGLDEE